MSILFEPVQIGNLTVKNRFMRSATYFALADGDGFVNEANVDLIRTLAENEVGLIIPGYAAAISGDLEEEVKGSEALVGPREASQISKFLKKFAV